MKQATKPARKPAARLETACVITGLYGPIETPACHVIVKLPDGVSLTGLRVGQQAWFGAQREEATK
jgi:hypothetical protein